MTEPGGAETERGSNFLLSMAEQSNEAVVDIQAIALIQEFRDGPGIQAFRINVGHKGVESIVSPVGDPDSMTIPGEQGSDDDRPSFLSRLLGKLQLPKVTPEDTSFWLDHMPTLSRKQVALGAGGALVGGLVTTGVAAARTDKVPTEIQKEFKMIEPITMGQTSVYMATHRSCSSQPGPLRITIDGRSSLKQRSMPNGSLTTSATVYYHASEPGTVRLLHEVPPTGQRQVTVDKVPDCGERTATINTVEARSPGNTSPARPIRMKSDGPGAERLRFRVNGEDALVTGHGKPDAVRWHSRMGIALNLNTVNTVNTVPPPAQTPPPVNVQLSPVDSYSEPPAPGSTPPPAQ